MTTSTTIPKQPVLKTAEDYYNLRREGIGYIEQLGSALWTDYNTHDPGITIIEALCYAISDLAYRTGWNIKDLLTTDSAPADPENPFPTQPFFTAREILTVNPCTPDDFRRLLIDLDTIRNSWIFCKECSCDLSYYAWCEKDQLRLSYQKPSGIPIPAVEVSVKGLYEILLELESDPELGDLNNRKIEQTFNLFDDDGSSHQVILELRFPDWGLEKWEEWKLLLNSNDAFANQNGASFNLTLLKFNRNKTDNTLMSDNELRNNWRNVFYASIEITLNPGGEKITIENASLRIFGDTTAKGQTTVAYLESMLVDTSTASLIQRYRNKLLRVKSAVDSAKVTLQLHRNLDEDYCLIRGVDVEDVAVCADVEVAADADIEHLQAQIWFEIEQYLNPPVPFYTLKELMEEGVAVEEIFNGPALDNGFIKAEELEAADLKTVLRTSDIVNRLIDTKLKGVIAVNNLLLTKYDAEGNVAKGAADPIWINGNPIFESAKSSASWLLFMSPMHQPRLYHNLSRFLFYKNGLPFLPRMDEAYDILIQLKGEAERPKIKNAPKDLTILQGTFRNPEDYTPLQYGFPLTYGIGTGGLPSHASNLRRAQAKQLKAYLMPFEQILGNAYAQIAHTADLFSLDPLVKRTYFIREFSEAIITGYNEITSAPTATQLEEMTETTSEFHERRNRFLDHLMARFGEQFGEYALLITNFEGEEQGFERLIGDKISFLKAYPQISHNRSRAFNYAENPCAPDNIPGLKRRISLLLGYPDLSFFWTISGIDPGPYTVTHYQLIDGTGVIWMEGDLTITNATLSIAKQIAYREIILQMIQPTAYEMVTESGQFRIQLKDKDGNQLGEYPLLFDSKSEGQTVIEELLSWSSNTRMILVEHFLLRPKFAGDALYPACSDGSCKTCGDDDPYSFRLTFVMPGWTSPYNDNLEMRGFADRTIREQTPSHLIGKICWVGNDGFTENLCDPVVSDLTELLETKGLTSAGVRPDETAACACANAIYTAFTEVFKAWYLDKTLDYLQPDALKTALENEFNTAVDPLTITCTTLLTGDLWTEIKTAMVDYFLNTALYGWQFERFENAWCKWLEKNSAIDWTEERLHDRLEAMLLSNLVAGNESDLCVCATDILTNYGMAFFNWMDANFRAGNAFKDFTVFTAPALTLCAGSTFKSGTDTQVTDFLNDRYETYKEVSYCLWVVVNLLSKLRNIYPGATLHDCDDGSDQNPVRLGSTALGNYTSHAST